MTGRHLILSYRHFERSPRIFFVRDQADHVYKLQTENLLSPKPSGIALYICGEAATFIPNSSFEQSFHPQSKDNSPGELTLNPEPFSI